jgi:hypothetical protein
LPVLLVLVAVTSNAEISSVAANGVKWKQKRSETQANVVKQKQKRSETKANVEKQKRRQT